MATNKVVYNGTTLIDLENDTAIASDVLQGKTFHTADGLLAIGSLVPGPAGNIASGTITVDRASSSTKNVLLAAIDEIGFTPKAFLLVTDSYSTTKYFTQMSSYVNYDGNGYTRFTIDRSDSEDSYKRDDQDWTVQDSGLLYCDGSSVYFRNSSSHRLTATTYRWYAMTW